MSDIDLSEFKRITRKKRLGPCRVAQASAKLSKPDAAKLQAALDALDEPSGEIDASGIIAWLEARKVHDISSPSALTAHRKKACICYV